MSRLPPLESLEAVLEAVRHGSFSGAAAGLGITHGAVSRRVSTVEQWAGYRIFDRHGRGVTLSVPGHALVQQIERAMGLLNDSRRIHRRSPHIESVRLSVVTSFARMWLLPNLAALEGDPPDLRIEVDADDRFMSLSKDRIAIRHGNGQWPGARCAALQEEFAVPVASHAVAQSMVSGVHAAALLEWPLLHNTTSRDWGDWLGHFGIVYQARSEDRFLPAYDLVLLAAAQGAGIAILRKPYGVEMASRLSLVAVSGAAVPLSERFHLLTSAKGTTPATERLAGRLQKLLGPREPDSEARLAATNDHPQL